MIGEGQRPDMAVARWAVAARAGRPLTVLGSLHRTRDVTDVRVVSQALVDLLGAGPQTINIGSGHPRSLGELVAAVGRAVDVPVDVRLMPASTEEPSDTWADTAKLERLLGPRPQTDLDDAVRRAVCAPTRARVPSP